MKVLIVGAGAVGQVYGHHLQMGGAEVWYFVKPEHAGAARQGFVLYDLRKSRQPPPLLFHPAGVLTTKDEVARQQWDQVWLSISSPALRGPWLESFLSSIGEATLVNLTPGLDDRGYLERQFPAERLISGVIAIIAWQTPLPTEKRPRPGIAYWIPPFAASLYDGPSATEVPISSIVATLGRGGCPARRHRDAAFLGDLASAAMLPIIRGIELDGWSLSRFARSGRSALAARAGREAMTVVARVSGRKIPWSRHLVGGPVVRIALTLAPHLVPFDLEAYLQHHFTKVGDQTRQMLGDYVARGTTLGCPVAALEDLSR